MKQENPRRRLTSRFMVVVGIAALMLLAVQVVLAYAPVESVSVGPYQVDLVTYTLNTNDSLWVYAITAVPTETEYSALSHWVLGFDLSCYEDVEPEVGATVNTLSQDECNFYTDGTPYYNCQLSDYLVDHGNDPTTGLIGVKWDLNAGEPLMPSDTAMTHMFELRLYGTEQYAGDAVVGVKYGDIEEQGSITGPVCDPSAVDVTALSAAPGGRWALTFVLVGLVAVVLMGTIREVRERR